MRLKVKKILAVIMVLSMVIAAGCQAVAGVDLNQVIKNMMKVTSAEGKYELEFKLNLNEDELAMIAEEAGEDEEQSEQFIEMLRQYSHVKLAINEYKQQDEYHASMKGAITFGDQTSLGFDLSMSDKLAVIKLDGAKQPFSLDLTGEHEEELRRYYYETELGWDYEEMFGSEELEGTAEADYDEAAVIAAVQKMSELITDFSVGHLPNIERLSVKPVIEQINGVSTDLIAIQGEIKGLELWDWAKKLVSSLASDREGLEKLIGEIFNIYAEQEEQLAALGLGGAESYVLGIGGPMPEAEDDAGEYIETEEEAELSPEEIKQQIVDELLTMLSELEQSMTEMNEEDLLVLEQVLNDSLQIAFDYRVDSSLNLRKQSFSLHYSIDPALKQEAELYGVDGFSITAASQFWNVNGEVKAKEPAKTLNTVSVESLAYMQGFEVVELFEKDSLIDKLLREQFRITKQSYWNYLDEEWEYSVYLNDKKQAMIPARDIMEQFGGKVTYNPQTKQVFLLDKATNTTIEIAAGSNIAVINGEEVQWSAPVEARHGIVFVPARAMAEALGAEIDWYNEGYLEITREP